jgi:flagellar protein FlaG
MHFFINHFGLEENIMSSANAINSATGSGINVNVGGVAFNKQTIKTDAEVVSQAAKTVIKPSEVDQTSSPTRAVIAKAAQELQDFVQSMGRNLNFSIDEATGYHVVRVVNPDTGELIRQLPSEELLKVSREFARLNNALVSQVA